MPFGEYESFEDCVSKNQSKEDPAAYCAEIQRQIEGDRKRKIGFDTATLDAKVLVDDDDFQWMNDRSQLILSASTAVALGFLPSHFFQPMSTNCC